MRDLAKNMGKVNMGDLAGKMGEIQHGGFCSKGRN